MTVTIRHGDCREVLRTLPDESVHCCVTSPPYWGLRDYGVTGQIGLEQTPDAFVAEMVAVFGEARRVLRSDGTLWLNLGDSYANDGKFGGKTGGKQAYLDDASLLRNGREKRVTGLKPKDLVGIPWMVAFALRADGWYLRQWHPWVKRNPLPESTKDRPTTAVETIFLLTKSQQYFYDYEAVKRRASPSTNARLAQDIENQIGSTRANGGRKTNGNMKAVRAKVAAPGSGIKNNTSFEESVALRVERRALRNTDLFFDSLDDPYGAISLADGEIIAFDTVTEGCSEAHFATFPPKLIVPMIVAGCPAGGTVLDPFGGSGTTGMVADRLQRDAMLIELNSEYAGIAKNRIQGDAGMFSSLTIGKRNPQET
jgi:DNA modification methylase